MWGLELHCSGGLHFMELLMRVPKHRGFVSEMLKGSSCCSAAEFNCIYVLQVGGHELTIHRQSTTGTGTL